MNISEHLELSSNPRLAQIIKWNSTASLTFPMKFFCIFLSIYTLAIAWMLTVREHMHFINEVINLGEVKANHDS